MEQDLGDYCDTVRGNLATGYQEVVTQIQTDLRLMIERYSCDKDSTASRKGAAIAKGMLHQDLSLHFEALHKAFGIEPPVEEEDVLPEEHEEPQKAIETIPKTIDDNFDLLMSEFNN